jgi:hypothetical protein
MTTIDTTASLLYREPTDLVADVKIPDEFLTLTDADLQEQVGKQARYININQDVETEARNLAYKKLTTLATTTDSGKIELNDNGKAFVAKLRATKCTRKNCSHNLGQTYNGYGRGKFKTTEDLSDNQIVREFAPYTFEKIRDVTQGWNLSSGIKQTVKPRTFFIQVEQRPNNSARLGYCSRACQEVQERANENKRPEVPSVIKATLKAVGYVYHNKHSDKRAAIWTSGPNKTHVSYKFADATLYLSGYGIVDGNVRMVKLGVFTLGQLGALIDAANAAKSNDVLEATIKDNNAPSVAELESLQSMIYYCNTYLEQAKTQVEVAEDTVANKNISDEERVLAAIAIAKHEAEVVAYGQLLSRAEGRIEQSGTNWNRPAVTPVPWLLTEAQLELAKGDESFEKRAARFGVSL